MAETVESREELREGSTLAANWYAVLAGPIAWMLGLQANYSLVRVACARGSMGWLHLVSALTLALAVSGGVVAWREWHRAGAQWPGEEGGPVGRARFMAAMGLLASALFALVIVAQWVANLFLNPCAGI